MNSWILLCTVLVGCQAFVDYSGHQVWRVHPGTEHQVTQLIQLMDKFDFWLEDFSVDSPADIQVSPQSQHNLRRWMRENDLQYTVIVQDLQTLLDAERLGRQSKPAFVGTLDLDTSRYYTLEEIYDYMDAVADGYDDVDIFEIGHSYEERPLRGLKITGRGDGNRRAVWLDCGIHAREWISPAICQYAIHTLVSSTDADVTRVREAYDWYVYPVVNVDGYAYTHSQDRMWRKTRKPNEGSSCVGTDGNRNFLVGWAGTGSSSNPCSQTYRGEEALSEVEIRALDDHMTAHRGQFDLGITIHSYGQFMVYPWGYTKDFDPDNIDNLDRVCQAGVWAIENTNGISFSGRRSNGDMAGNTIDSLMQRADMRYTYLFEVRDTGEFGFLLPENQILPTDQEIWAGIQKMALEILDIDNGQ